VAPNVDGFVVKSKDRFETSSVALVEPITEIENKK
jgi:hypothetical protein